MKYSESASLTSSQIGDLSLSKQEMRDVEDRLERNPELPKWDILIQPAILGKIENWTFKIYD